LEIEPLEKRALLSSSGISTANLPYDAALVEWQGQERLAAAGRWIVSFDDVAGSRLSQDATAGEMLAAAGLSNQLSVVRNLGADGLFLLDVAAPMVPEDMYDALRQLPGFRYAEPDFLLSAETIPNDPSFGQLYGLHNTGQTVNGDPGTADADIDAVEAWDTGTGSSDIVVAVIDTGIDYTHSDLVNNIWTNPGEIPGNLLDDDLNGYVDDVHGYDFYNFDGDPFDDNSHGTHVAGTIGAQGNNGVGVAGVNWDVTLMALKFLPASGSGPTSGAVAAVNYVSMMSDRGINIRLTNNSWGGGGYSQFLYDAIANNRNRDILFVAAAGNDGTNNDTVPHYPSSYDLDNIIAVAATNNDDNLAPYNWGPVSVDLAAPGYNIRSTIPGGLGFKSGTSMATPHVSGAAALAFSHKPNATYTEVRNAILNGVDVKASLTGLVATNGRLNLVGMLDGLGLRVTVTMPAADSTVSVAPTDFVVDFSDPYSVASVDETDFTVNGTEADSFTLDDADTITFHFNSTPLITEGLQLMEIGDGLILRDSDSDPIDPFSANFRYDVSPITVTATAPADGSNA
jgi:subtilisin family serine protease